MKAGGVGRKAFVSHESYVHLADPSTPLVLGNYSKMCPVKRCGDLCPSRANGYIGNSFTFSLGLAYLGFAYLGLPCST